jgi:hypothetical protein
MTGRISRPSPLWRRAGHRTEGEGDEREARPPSWIFMDVVLVTSPVMPDVDDHVPAIQCGIEIWQHAPVGGTFAETRAAQPCPTVPDSQGAPRF